MAVFTSKGSLIVNTAVAKESGSLRLALTALRIGIQTKDKHICPRPALSRMMVTPARMTPTRMTHRETQR